MKPTPVRKYTPPKYPTRLEAGACPALLHRHQPPAWRKWPELTSAAGLFLLADTARLSAAESLQQGSQTPAQTDAVAVVAPIFLHGAGRGATGCIIMSPPVFLSEEEALQVIREEMAAKDIKLGTDGTEVAGVILERYVWLGDPPGTTNQVKAPKAEIRRETFKADAADPQKKVFVEFLGERDGLKWDWERRKEEGQQGFGSVQLYELPRTACYFAERVKREATGKVYVGTFYDPIAGRLDVGSKQEPGRSSGPTGEWKNVKFENGKVTGTWSRTGDPPWNQSRRLLRLQVQDFLKWLQAQGVI